MAGSSLHQREPKWLTLGGIYDLVGSTLILAIGGLTAVDVFGRYVLAKPVFGAFDMVEAMMALAIFWFLPSVSGAGNHISVGLIQPVRGRLLSQLRLVLIEVVCILAIGMLAYQFWHSAGEFRARGEASLILQIPVAPVVYALSSLSALTALVHIARLFQRLAGKTLPGEEGYKL